MLQERSHHNKKPRHCNERKPMCGNEDPVQPPPPQKRICMLLCLATQSCLTLCDPMGRGTWKATVRGDSPGKNTGVGCHGLLLRMFPTRGSNPSILHCRQILYQLSHKGILVYAKSSLDNVICYCLPYVTTIHIPRPFRINLTPPWRVPRLTSSQHQFQVPGSPKSWKKEQQQ